MSDVWKMIWFQKFWSKHSNLDFLKWVSSRASVWLQSQQFWRKRCCSLESSVVWTVRREIFPSFPRITKIELRNKKQKCLQTYMTMWSSEMKIQKDPGNVLSVSVFLPPSLHFPVLPPLPSPLLPYHFPLSLPLPLPKLGLIKNGQLCAFAISW